MAKIIIDNQTDLPWGAVLAMVCDVINEGRVSNYGKQYCYASTFTRPDGEKYSVVTDLNKKSDKFTVYAE